ncbi:unnamed protein product [Ambrosiozyma monospora]|uniref:Unnamed protein product n=1 Tax=Ambrosiozyma monospora TaxID=43982 RepID=A0ACB5TDC1_AMBMO|nr:unnamed protein product [Ambrosiozyma monospora]
MGTVLNPMDQEILREHHQTLQYLVHVVPTSINTLPQLLKTHYPNKHSSKDCLLNYVKNLLCIVEYCDILKSNVWSLLIENFIKLDVELQNELDDVDDDDLDLAVPSPTPSPGDLDSDERSGDDSDSELEEDADAANHNRRVKKGGDAKVELTKSAQKEKRAMATDDDDFQDYEENDSEEEEYAVEIHKIGDISKKLDSIMALLLVTSTTTSSPFMPSTFKLNEEEAQPKPDLDSNVFST